MRENRSTNIACERLSPRLASPNRLQRPIIKIFDTKSERSVLSQPRSSGERDAKRKYSDSFQAETADTCTSSTRLEKRLLYHFVNRNVRLFTPALDEEAENFSFSFLK